MIKHQCAIYTRKSHSEGLDQDFNSLDAQREACEAFITSQKHEGWLCKKTAYDDAAYSGGTLNRPAMTQLLNDVAEGKVKVIVVYKVDRLTRSLADFVKLIELFDKHDVSFVSVTQQFNTTSSMGRLTLNVLLSFAQFEREVTGERIRDKVSASKKKGMWMGGPTPLGYDVVDHKLIINPLEAETVHLIFDQYLASKSVKVLKQTLDSEGVVSKTRVNRKGENTGSKLISRGSLYRILNNPLYRGMIRHKSQIYQGLHAAIITDTTWEKVQALLKENSDAATHGLRTKQPSLLAGKLFDDKGNYMSPSHAVKNGKRYRYYTSQAIIQQTPEKAGSLSRIPAGEIEGAVLEKIKALLSNNIELTSLVESTAAETKAYADEAKVLASNLSRHPDKLRKLITKITLSSHNITLYISKAAIHKTLSIGPPVRDELLELQENISLQRCQGENKLILDTSSSEKVTKVNSSLINALTRAYVWNKKLLNNEVKSVRELAKHEGITPRYARSILPLANLAPDIVERILEGRQPGMLTLETLRNISSLNWTEQQSTLKIQFSH